MTEHEVGDGHHRRTHLADHLDYYKIPPPPVQHIFKLVPIKDFDGKMCASIANFRTVVQLLSFIMKRSDTHR